MRPTIPPLLLLALGACSDPVSPLQELAPEVPLPLLGSAEAQQAEAAFLAWQASLPTDLGFPQHQDMRFILEFRAGQSTTKSSSFTFDAEVATDWASFDRLRSTWTAQWTQTGEPLFENFDDPAATLHGDFLFDGETFWVKARSSHASLLGEDVEAIRIAQVALEEDYRSKFPAAPSAAGFRWPETLASAFHPSTTRTTWLQFFRCLRFDRTDTAVDAYFQLDLQEGSRGRTAIEGFLAWVERHIGPMPEKERVEILDLFAALPDWTLLHLRMDARDGRLMLLDLDFQVDGDDARAPWSTVDLTFDLWMESAITYPENLPVNRLSHSDFPGAVDRTFLLRMLGMRRAKDAERIESEGDIPF